MSSFVMPGAVFLINLPSYAVDQVALHPIGAIDGALEEPAPQAGAPA